MDANRAPLHALPMRPMRLRFPGSCPPGTRPSAEAAAAIPAVSPPTLRTAVAGAAVVASGRSARTAWGAWTVVRSDEGHLPPPWAVG